MGAASVRVVQQNGIAGLHLDLLNSGLNRKGHRPQMNGDVSGLSNHVPLLIEDRAREIAPLFDIG